MQKIPKIYNLQQLDTVTQSFDIYYFRGLFFDQFVVKQQGYKGSLQC